MCRMWISNSCLCNRNFFSSLHRSYEKYAICVKIAVVSRDSVAVPADREKHGVANRYIHRCHWHRVYLRGSRCAREQRAGQLKESRKGASEGRQLHVDVWRRRNTTRVSGEQNARGMCAKYHNFRDMRYVSRAKEIRVHVPASLSLSLSLYLYLPISLFICIFPFSSFHVLVCSFTRTRSTIPDDRENRGKRLSFVMASCMDSVAPVMMRVRLAYACSYINFANWIFRKLDFWKIDLYARNKSICNNSTESSGI